MTRPDDPEAPVSVGGNIGPVAGDAVEEPELSSLLPSRGLGSLVDGLHRRSVQLLLQQLVVGVGVLNVVVLLALVVVRSGGDDSSAVADDGRLGAEEPDTTAPSEPITTTIALETSGEDGTDEEREADQEVRDAFAPAVSDPFEPTANEVQPEAKYLGALVAHRITNYEPTSTLDDVLGSVDSVGPEFVDAMVLEVQAVHHPGMWSRGTVEYAQLGGWLDNRISIIVVIRQEIGRENSGTPERVETRTMEIRLAGSAADGWTLETIASVGGRPIDRPTDLDPVAAAVVDHERIDLPDTAVWDVYEGKIDRQLLELMLDLADRMSYSVVVFQTGHAYHVFGTDRVSNHSAGRAVDIYSFDSKLVIDSHDRSSDLYALSEWIVSRYDIREFGSPWLFPEAVAHTFTNEVHHDHLHVGVFQYPTSPDPPTTTTTTTVPPSTTTTVPPSTT
ncbi:MAG: hypothetical protein ACPHJY_14410, partial [Acidimicrobiales bacterium]